jgi:hypothetical protein
MPCAAWLPAALSSPPFRCKPSELVVVSLAAQLAPIPATGKVVR